MNYKNQEGYADTTAAKAIENIKRKEDITKCVKIIKSVAYAYGFEVAERIVFEDMRTGERYR